MVKNPIRAMAFKTSSQVEGVLVCKEKKRSGVLLWTVFDTKNK
jgi:hypothetical protein